MVMDSPNMSTATLLVSVEELINMAMGPPDVNQVNFKIVQTILHILARQLRVLETRVDVRISDLPPRRPPEEPAKEKPTKEQLQAEIELATTKERQRQSRSATRDRIDAEAAVRRAAKTASKDEEREARIAKKDKEREEKAISKDIDKAEKATKKEEEAKAKEREKADRAASKEREKAEKFAEKGEKAVAKEKEKADKAATKDQKSALKEKEKEEKAAIKDKEKADRATSKEREKEEKAAAKEKEKGDKAAAKDKEKGDKAAAKEKEKEEKEAAKQKEKGDKAATKEKEKEEKEAAKQKEKGDKAATKEKEKEEKAAAKEKEKGERATSKEREKEEKTAAKDKEKGEKAASKEREKEEKAAAKEKDKGERAASKEREKEEKAAAKEKDKGERAASKEREKEEKAAAKEKERGERATAKEREKEKVTKGKERTSISVTEEQRNKEKILVVDKGPKATRSETRGRSTIDVVTVSQFEQLENVVRDLASRAGPMPMPAMPDNKKLRSDLAKGTASLTDTMQAMQVNARVLAAEQGISRMGDLLTQLAAAGALPKDIASKVDDVKQDLKTMDDMDAQEGRDFKPRLSRKSVGIDVGAKSQMLRPSTAGGGTTAGGTTTTGGTTSSIGRPSVVSRASSMSTASGMHSRVTRADMDEAIHNVKNDLMKNIQNQTNKAATAADSAVTTSKSVSEKLDIALGLDSRISRLHALTMDYSEQLAGFDAGLGVQLQGFQEQMNQIKGDLSQGLKQLENVNNNAETAAVMELNERFEGLVGDLQENHLAHKFLMATQDNLGGDLRILIDSVEMLREAKADRDEMLDGLRDKADISKLAGLLTETEFGVAREELECRLNLCYEKFRKQESVWTGALKDLTDMSETKAELIQLLGMREEVQQLLQDLNDQCYKLALVLGEPKSALATRQICRGATCGPCMVPTLMNIEDKSYGVPLRMPSSRPRPIGAEPEEQPCLTSLQPPSLQTDQPPERLHTCHRWVGGSHTLVSDAVTRLQAVPPDVEGKPKKKYKGLGMDGHTYNMEEELLPCAECNKLSEEVADPPTDGGGDRGEKKAD